MMDANQEKYHDQIDAYLREELSSEDRALFEQSLLEDQELKKEFLIHKELFALEDDSIWIQDLFDPDESEVKQVEAYFKSEEVQNLKDVISTAQSNYTESDKKKSIFVNKKWFIPILVAASFTLLFFVYTFNSGYTAQELYAEYGEWDDLPSLTSRSDETQLAEGQRFFEQKEFLASYELFKNLEDNKLETSPEILVYLGLSSLELNKYNEAISYFDQLINSDAIDQSKGYWYKALTYLKQEKKDKAISILEVILKDETNYKYIEAKELMGKIK
ncbi:tetratricopeptide repeat protein [Aquimarina sp. 2201CG5-10]|uniref:tetratricopeptide repeat protein n=1 Tax=Aquimarina callyspongiae TaxID=3098150 RepID=UPI002AB3511F|nr:tetratricopeptide repeat protein [Aquimarina sp. 2201CG5-10]MDY8138617.1 tetratricopeptide repeat protein [Aquimarina sp. 2201CG5-10]